MAFGVKYRSEFTDILGVDWKIDIQEDGFASAITELQASGSPLVIEWYGDDDIYEQNVCGSKATLNIEASSDFQLSDLFASDNLEYKFIIYQSGNLFWSGWILANNYAEPYDAAPFTVSIVATDGLGLLSDYKFKDLGYTTRQKASVVIHDILDVVQITEFTEFVNVFESTMNEGVGDSPFDQSGIHWERFENEDLYTALNEILSSFNARIIQDQGVFIIHRFKELKDSSMKGRTYTDGTTKSATTRTPAQYINRAVQSSNFHDFLGGTLTIYPQYKEVIANQDYGFRKSIFENYNFPYAEFVWDTDHWNILGWTKAGNGYLQPVSITKSNILGFTRGSTDAEGGILTNRDATTLPDYYYQTVSAIESTNKLVIELEVSLVSYNGSPDTGTLYVQLISTDGVDTEYFYGATIAWDATERWITEVSDCTKDLNWKQYSYSIDEVPFTGDFTIKIFAGFDHVSDPGNIMAAYRNVCVYWANDDGVAPEGIGYTISNNIAGKIYEKELKLGDCYGFDNDHLQYSGCLNVYSSGDPIPPSKVWETVTAGTGNGENTTLVQLMGQEIADQHNRPKHVIDLPMREMAASSFFKLVGNLQDTENKNGGNNRIFAPSFGIFDVRNREWQLTLCELI